MRATLVLAVGTLLVAPTLTAAQVTGSGNEPIVTELELYGALEGERSQRLDPRRDIRLAPRQSITIEVEPRDQYGRRFPRERFRIEAELDRSCRGVLSVSEIDDGGLQFSAGRERGECRAMLWGDVAAASRSSAVSEVQRGRVEQQVESMLASAEFAAIRQAAQPADVLEALYRGLLRRAPDSGGAREYLDEIRRGRYQRAVMNLIQSPEFEAQIADRR